MRLARVYTRASAGLAAPLVTVEAHLSNGLPGFSIVGLPETAVRESKDRVRSAIINSGFEFPAQRITVNLAPADLPKEGGRYDLPIAIGVLAASRQLPDNQLEAYEFAGELALSGELRAFRGALPFAVSAKASKRSIILPRESLSVAQFAEAPLLPASHLLAVCAHLKQVECIEISQGCSSDIMHEAWSVDFQEIKGQPQARRALELAAAGKHSLLMSGSPGAGKSMLAMRLPSLLPELTVEEALETATIASVSKHGFSVRQWRARPFRAPHHTATAVALAGGGSPPRPGEISLAHTGVLFLDELPEFSRSVLEVLREPLESKRILISRASVQAEYPANFQLVAAMNPCPCGYLGDEVQSCRCSTDQIQRYQGKLSGPLLDRIDLHIEVPPVSLRTLTQVQSDEESSETVRARVSKAWQVQRQRNAGGMLNYELNNREVVRICALEAKTQHYLLEAMEKLRLSGRSYFRVLRVARTIADLEGRDSVTQEDLSEAMGYRPVSATYT